MGGQTLTDKILSRAAGKVVTPGDIVEISVDLVGFHDLTGFHVIEVIESVGYNSIPHPEKLVIAFDHLVPPPDIRSAEIQKLVRELARRSKVVKFHDIGDGILHQVLLERYVEPGQVVVGADSHTSTAGALGAFAQGMGATDVAATLLTGKTWVSAPQPFKIVLSGGLKKWVTGKDVALQILKEFKADYFNGMSIEFYVDNPGLFPIDYRATIANMGIEFNADSVIFVPDTETFNFLSNERGIECKKVLPDSDASYVDEFTIELKDVDLLVAAPYSVDNVKSVQEIEGMEVDMVFIGSCTNGRLSDLEIAAQIMKGRKVKSRCVVIPASRRVFNKALELGYIQTLVSAGCIVTFGTCGPCIGGHFGVAGPDEVILSTSNRNFKGRMGSPTSKTFLVGPSVAAASAVSGKVSEPGDLP
ncbi:MAG: 3-isopropylmalate dehydratase large subunit [Sulfolobales archaeon]